MTNDDRDTILIRIKKLLALAKHNSNENEAAMAAAKAQEMLLQYNLDEAELDSVRVDREEKFTMEYTTNHRAGINEIRWKILLAFGVAQANLCKVIHIGNERRMCWLGKPSNIAVAQYLFDTLCSDLEYIADEKWKQLLELRKMQAMAPDIPIFTDQSLLWVHGKTWKKSFFLGAVETIRKRLTENLETLKTNENINALVTTNDSALKTYFREQFPHTGKYRGNKGTINWSGYAAGQAAGKNVSFKTGVGSGGSVGPKMLNGKN